MADRQLQARPGAVTAAWSLLRRVVAIEAGGEAMHEIHPTI